MITLARRASPPVPGAAGTWWDYSLATRSGRNRMSGSRQGTRAEVEDYLRGVLRRMEALEHPGRRWRDAALVLKGSRAPVNHI